MFCPGGLDCAGKVVNTVHLMGISRERVLGCACELYLADGLEGFSMRKLANTLGVTAPALYRHYAGREALLLDVIGEAFKVFGSYLYRALEGGTPQERLRLSGDAYVAFALEHPRFYEVIHASPRLLGMVDLPADAFTQACTTRQFLIDRVRECMEAGVLAQDDPEAVAVVIWSFSHGLVSLYLNRVLPVPEEHFLEFFHSAFPRVFLGVAGEQFVAPRAPAPMIQPLTHGAR
jgi:AcrR family transcriptional regulator